MQDIWPRIGDAPRNGLRSLAGALACLALTSTIHSTAQAHESLPRPAGVTPGDAARGQAIIIDRQAGFCLLCHPASFGQEASQGNLAPALDGAGARWSRDQLRLRITDPRRIHAATIMPPYGVADAAPMTAPRFAGRPILSTQQIEDVIAFLAELK